MVNYNGRVLISINNSSNGEVSAYSVSNKKKWRDNEQTKV